MHQTLAIFAIFFFASFVQGLAGQGVPFILIPLLTLFFSIKSTIPLVTLVALTINLYLVFQLREHIPWKKLLPFFITTLPMLFIGVYFLKTANPALI